MTTEELIVMLASDDVVHSIFVFDDGKCDSVAGVRIRWEDGTDSWMDRVGNDWRFPNENAEYESGYAYACGYQD